VFDDHGQIQRCHWLKESHNLEIRTGHIQRRELNSQSQPPPCIIKTRNFATT